jgi:PTS system cellobiose-specific IIA component
LEGIILKKKKTLDGEDICLNIIKSANSAKVGYLQGIQLAKQKEFKTAVEKINAADENFNQAHDIHTKLLQSEAEGGKTGVDLLLVHAEDIMMNAEMCKIFAMEIVALYLKISEKS